jgi:FXSXX-COOH protein
MCDDLVEVNSAAVTALSPSDVMTLGDSALDHAVRRIRDRGQGGSPAVGEPVAAFQDSM